MFISNNMCGFMILATFLVFSNLCSCMPSDLNNSTLAEGGFSPAVATWYDDPNGPGSGAACGFGGASDVANAPYYGMTAAGNQNLFKHGEGCGSCYMVKCTGNSLCSGNAITITITNECPGTCNNEAYHFDLSGKAFGYLATKGQEDALRKYGRIDVQYSRVDCHYNSNIAFKIDSASNKYFLALAVKNVNGDGEIGRIEIYSSNGKTLYMQRDWGENWKVGLPEGAYGPYSVKLFDVTSKSVYAPSVIPANWTPGQTYWSSVNF